MSTKGKDVKNSQKSVHVVYKWPPGVRKFLIAYNINLVSTKEQAHRIALNLRSGGRGKGQEGRLKAVQGIGWWLEEKNIAQVNVCTYLGNCASPL